jgi:hypothetical protein
VKVSLLKLDTQKEEYKIADYVHTIVTVHWIQNSTLLKGTVSIEGEGSEAEERKPQLTWPSIH